MPVLEPASEDPHAGHGSSGETSEGGETGLASTGPGTGTSETGEAPDADTCTFLNCDDMGESGLPGCDTFEQTCPAGQKCTTTYMPDQGGFTNHCVEVQPEAKAEGDFCQLRPDLGAGVDDCALGSLCWDPDPVTGIGMCVALCGGTAEAPLCDAPDTFCSYGKSIQLCLQVCEPLDLETCPVGCTCVGGTEGFMCVIDASGDLGAYADPCEFLNTCDPGNQCIDSAAGPDCDPGISGCCMPMCDMAAPDCPHPDLECLPWYEPGSAPDGQQTLGICMLPQ